MASILENNTTTIDELITMANNLPDAGSGEDISTETAEYTAQLDELEATIEGLPDAGGGSVETCTVIITCSQAMISYANVSYTTVNSEDNIEYLSNAMVAYGTQFTVACRTILYISFLDEITSYTLENAKLELRSGNGFVLSIDAEQGETVKITALASSGQA